nr:MULTISPECIES: carboxypeptidase-like regulatory domain-containing protein [unclassified Haladaptatus]
MPTQGVAPSTTDAASITSHPEQRGTPTRTGNNSTVHQENPDDVKSDQDSSALEKWLVGQLSSQLGRSVVHLKQGEYQRARSVLGDQYDDTLDKYVDVAGETDGHRDDKTAKTLNSTQKSQDKYVSRVQRYRKLHDRYEQAKRNGNDRKARHLARRLDRIQKNISQSSDDLTSNYGRLSNDSNIDTTDEIRTVRNVTRNISKEQAAVRKEEFIATNLTATVESPSVSFHDPLRISGRLTDANGTGIGNRSIRLHMGDNRTIRVQTDDNGTFTVVGRPTVLPLGTQPFRIDYQPSGSSIYLGSNTTVRANVSQVPSAVTISKHTRRTRYNETVTVSGKVRSKSVPAVNVPVAIFIGGTQIGTTNTTTGGTFSFHRRVPATVPPGSQTVRVTIPLQHKALAASSKRKPITIESTATNLTLSGTPMGNQNGTGSKGEKRRVKLTGKLRAADGTPIENQPVAILVGGTTVKTVQTNANGTYRTMLRLPSKALTNHNGTKVVATFDGKGSNLRSARATTALVLAPGGHSDDHTVIRWLIGIVLVGIGSLLLWQSGIVDEVRRRTGGDGDTATTDGIGPAAETDSPAETTSTADSSESTAMTGTLLDRARAAFESDEYDRAVELAYSATRYRLGSAISTPTSTHWEFYNACREADLSDETVSTIADVTERYEYAVFTTRRVSREMATSVLDSVTSLVGED